MEIKELVDATGLSKEKLSETLHISKPTLYNWMNGKTEIGENHLRIIKQLAQENNAVIEEANAVVDSGADEIPLVCDVVLEDYSFDTKACRTVTGLVIGRGKKAIIKTAIDWKDEYSKKRVVVILDFALRHELYAHEEPFEIDGKLCFQIRRDGDSGYSNNFSVRHGVHVATLK